MTKRKRTNQKKTHPKLYQNKRSLAGTVIFKITERKRKARSFGILSRLRAFFVVVFKGHII